MKTRHLYAAVLAVALLGTTSAWAQYHDQFDDHDRQVTRDWHNQNQAHPSRGLRPQDRLTRDQELRFERGRLFDRDLRRHAYSVPSNLRHRLPPPPPHHQYYAVGGHIALVDTVHYIVRDIIRLSQNDRH
jgi:Ni/Co efflux regulator RcnB